MKAILEFNLPDEKSEYDLCNNASKMFSALYEIKERLHSIIKYGFSVDIKTPEHMLKHIIEIFNEEIKGLDI